MEREFILGNTVIAQSPVHDTRLSMKLQTIKELKYLKEGVTNTNLKSQSHICNAYLSNAPLQYMDILAECKRGGRFIDW